MYTEKMNNVMKEVDFFISIYGICMGNGINFKTDLFKGELSQELQNINGIPLNSYEKISEEVVLFKDYLKEFVNKEDFFNVWKNLTDNEKKYLIYFDKNVYSILRSKLSIEDIGLINFEKKIYSMKIDWDEKFFSILNLPIELHYMPQNNLQFFMQIKKLKSIGFTDNELTDFIHAKNSAIEIMPNKLLLLWLKNKDFLEKLNILNSLDDKSMDYSFHYLTNFISGEEKNISKSNSLRI